MTEPGYNPGEESFRQNLAALSVRCIDIQTRQQRSKTRFSGGRLRCFDVSFSVSCLVRVFRSPVSAPQWLVGRHRLDGMDRKRAACFPVSLGV